MMQDSGRKEFQAKMFEEALKAYECPGGEWSEDEKEFLPIFTRLVGFNNLVLDLAGGYGRVTPYLMQDDNIVVLGDLSPQSLKLAKKGVPNGNLPIVRVVFCTCHLLITLLMAYGSLRRLNMSHRTRKFP
jgi:SAM-dependent methyltransferase